MIFSVDFQKTTCFNNTNQQSRPHTQQPRPTTQTYSAPFQETAFVPIPTASSEQSRPVNRDCDCSDNEIDEISERRQRIFDGNPGTSGCSISHANTKVSTSASSDTSSFEEVEPKLLDDNWEVIEKTASNGIKTLNEPTTSESGQTTSTAVNPEVRKLTRRRSDSSLLSLRKSSSIFLDTSALDPTQRYDREVKKLKVSCNKCGKAKSRIKSEVLKLSEQLMSSNKSEAEVNAKIKEFLDYLESKSQRSEVTETEASESIDENLEALPREPIPSSISHEEIEENIFDENEGINVYPSSSFDYQQPGSSGSRRFISLDDIHSE